MVELVIAVLIIQEGKLKVHWLKYRNIDFANFKG